MPVPLSADQWQKHWVQERELFLQNPRAHFKSYMREYRSWSSRAMLAILNLYLEGSDMARGKKSVSPATARTNQWTEFVDIPLSEGDFDEIAKAFPDLESVDEAIAELLDKGYRVSLSYNPGNDAFIASITCKDTESPNNGKTFNAFAGSWVEALQCALYKHYVKTRGVWGDPAQRPARARFG